MSTPDLPESPHKGQRGLQRLFNALFYSLSGLRLAFRHESAFRQEVALAVRDRGRRRRRRLEPLLGSVLFVFVVELLNSSVEAAIDRISFDTHRLSKRAKDLGSAAVLIALVMLAITWGLIVIGPLLATWAR